MTANVFARLPRGVLTLWVVVLALFGLACGSSGDGGSDDLNIVTSMEMLAEFAREVGGDRVKIRNLIPTGSDPHSFRPVPKDAVAVSQADLILTNGLLLEDASLLKLIEQNRPGSALFLSLAERTAEAGGHLIRLDESVDIDLLWLGLAVTGDQGSSLAEARLTLLGLRGPGRFYLYQTDTFGEPHVYFNTADGISSSDTLTLPHGSHTHLNWAFTAAGRYELTLKAELVSGGPSVEATYLFDIGSRGADAGRTRLTTRHADIAAEVSSGSLTRLYVRSESTGNFSPDQVILEALPAARVTVTDDKRFSFLGSGDIWVLPQAVVGRHVHGDLDPHVWLDPVNARAYVYLIRDALSGLDPEGASAYAANADRFLRELTQLEQEMTATLAAVPAANRKLVTTHDGFGYLAQRFGFQVVGFVVPSPAQEVSAAQVADLQERIRRQSVKAVFVEPQLTATARVLSNAADGLGVQVCRLYGDAYDREINSYGEMMRFNARELARCLSAG
jgi:anchored repeat ABC transporter substrate-binding protein